DTGAVSRYFSSPAGQLVLPCLGPCTADCEQGPSGPRPVRALPGCAHWACGALAARTRFRAGRRQIVVHGAAWAPVQKCRGVGVDPAGVFPVAGPDPATRGSLDAVARRTVYEARAAWVVVAGPHRGHRQPGMGPAIEISGRHRAAYRTPVRPLSAGAIELSASRALDPQLHGIRIQVGLPAGTQARRCATSASGLYGKAWLDHVA